MKLTTAEIGSVGVDEGVRVPVVGAHELAPVPEHDVVSPDTVCMVMTRWILPAPAPVACDAGALTSHPGPHAD